MAAGKFPIVGIGASAGGLAAFEAFLSALQADPLPGMAFVFVQHLSPDHKSILSELVGRHTRLAVHEVQDGVTVEANHVYIIPPNRDMALIGGKLQLLEHTVARGARSPIDFFFRSLAADQRERSICIILSGTGSDGTSGVRAVKGEGGMAMAQTPESTEFDGMPRAAIASGLIDYVLPPNEMAAQLADYVNRLFGQGRKTTPSIAREAPDVLAKICVVLRAKTGHDFSQYKEKTIVRRVERRMSLHQIERMSDYLRVMQQNEAEVEALFRDLLIGVTSFFRDTDAFESLTHHAIPRLFEGVPPGGPIRVWICGCSTGEEAYSVAILIQEHLEHLQQVYKVQIFATDIDRRATDQARTGVFPAAAATDVSPERLARFFLQNPDGSYRVQKVIRDMLIFSEQDVLRDPPFSRLGLICCRNLLIYLNSDLQKKLMPLFHYSLKPRGVLFLGNSETVGDYAELFEVLDRKAKIYARGPEPGGLPRPNFSGLAAPDLARTEIASIATDAGRQKLNLRGWTEQTLLKHFSHAGVLVNGHGEILYFHGRTGNYLEPAPGVTGVSVLTMARDGLKQELTSALYRAVAKKQAVKASGLRVKTNGHFVTVDLTILPAQIPLSAPISDLFLLIFQEREADETAAPKKELEAGGDSDTLASQITGLRTEMHTKDDYIQTIIEEMETSSEELKSSNEEMQSVNEEMQSTNEELETSREELQSVNEELATVNAELQLKVQSLSRVNDDMNNLLAGTGVGTLFVDHRMKIMRFTPPITNIVNLIGSDIGRPLVHIADNLVDYPNFASDVQEVLDTLIPVEKEAQIKTGNWYLLGIRPYRTLDNVIEGAVITFVDINERKLAEAKLREATRFRQALEIETVGIVFFKMDGPITFANEAFLKMAGYSQEDLQAGRILGKEFTAPEWMPAYLQALAELKTSGRSVPYEKECVRKDGSRWWALFAAHRISATESVEYVVDQTRMKRREEELKQSEERYRALSESGKQSEKDRS